MSPASTCVLNNDCEIEKIYLLRKKQNMKLFLLFHIFFYNGKSSNKSQGRLFNFEDFRVGFYQTKALKRVMRSLNVLTVRITRGIKFSCFLRKYKESHLNLFAYRLIFTCNTASLMFVPEISLQKRFMRFLAVFSNITLSLREGIYYKGGV